MKKLTILILLTFWMITSCSDDFLQEEINGNLEISQSFKTAADAEKAVYGAYDLLGSSMVWGDEWGVNFGHDMRFSNRGNGDARQISQLNYNAGLGRLQDFWLARYQVIAVTNLAFNRISDINEGEFSENKKAEYLAELIVIRALMYFDLVRLWGNVPLVIDEIRDLEDTDQIFVPNAPITEVYNQIISDMEEFVSQLPEGGPGEASYEAGRINRDAGKALLARVYLARGSQYDMPEDFQKVLALCKEVIGAKRFNLNGYFPDIFHPNAELIQREGLWKLKSSPAVDATDIKLGDEWNGIPGLEDNTQDFGGTTGGTHRMSRYNYHIWDPGDSVRMYWTNIRGGISNGTFVNGLGQEASLYAPEYLQYVRLSEVDDGSGNVDSVKWENVRRRTNGREGRLFLAKYRLYPVPNGYLSGLRGIDLQVIRMADVYLMFAEAYNEVNGGPGTYTPTGDRTVADLEGSFDVNSASAWDAVNLVRARARNSAEGRVVHDYDAGLPVKTTSEAVPDWKPGFYGQDNSGTDITLNCASCLPVRNYGSEQAAFRNEILYERAKELVGEMNSRWFDLVRRDKFVEASEAAAVYTNADYPSAPLNMTPRFYAGNFNAQNPAGTEGQIETIARNAPTFQSRGYLLPIPQGQLDANPKLSQNPGY
ncbi:RagB/SusD family nutrient uptake outer membrane protein [Flexithrix dorotheae]|uniref:RagB/SusD family nutrient uptake outer membrane protein n=1 Tax=Flexithrix dorotheae TaxID=70993 RepID=UPI00039F72EF|nr:RagB/SusD family nutrient uptake outer membrane protein [Flexithrix dorotheae]